MPLLQTPPMRSLPPTLHQAALALCLGTATLLLTACATPHSSNNSPHSTHHSPRQLAGADRDPHGCIPSAGYLWCQKTANCQRPWELAAQHGFANTAENWQQFCKNPPENPSN